MGLADISVTLLGTQIMGLADIRSRQKKHIKDPAQIHSKPRTKLD